ncbi:HNH endonuclease [Mycobacterium phage Zemanar]|uniref:HNH endonuclease n=3 Tax=Coopervirus TaxID=1982898 RepID=A0A7U0GD24_9CAUD|nr:HNH endonuclease [Mycobacterium phage Zemanar]AEJ95751.1 hypothetical protein ZEMANAR_77 [Mycobacterium phage Zemanar]QOC58638.1 hypothetical protein SEALOLALOVE_79 [Mycobacterium phage Lolalove]QQV92971.1 HNH endonuclease [Mycobacterium phage Hydro]
MSTLGERQHQQIRDYELRHGAAIGVPNRNLIMPRPKEGKHALLSMRVRAAGDQWVLMIKDQTGQGRHQPCAVCDWAVQASHPGHDPVPGSRYR